MAYTTVSKIRTTCGIESGEISDADVTLLIADAEKVVDRLMNTTYEAKTKIERLDSELGVSPEKFFLKKYPILRIHEIKINTTTVSPKYCKIYGGGRIELMTIAEKPQLSNDIQDNIIKYSYADLEISSTNTDTTADVVEGEGVSVAVTSSTGITTGNYVKIEGMDGYSEIALVSNVADSTHITVSISQPHESGSIVTKMEIPGIIIRLTDIITSLMMVARFMGASYDDIVGYDIDGLHVQKGEAYYQWKEAAIQFRNEYKDIIRTKRPKSAVV